MARGDRKKRVGGVFGSGGRKVAPWFDCLRRLSHLPLLQSGSFFISSLLIFFPFPSLPFPSLYFYHISDFERKLLDFIFRRKRPLNNFKNISTRAVKRLPSALGVFHG